MKNKISLFLLQYFILIVFVSITGAALYIYWYFFLLLIVLGCSLLFSWKIYSTLPITVKNNNYAHVSINILLPILLTIFLLFAIYNILPISLQNEINKLKNIRLDTNSNIEDINV
jgi:hypothetical protein